MEMKFEDGKFYGQSSPGVWQEIDFYDADLEAALTLMATRIGSLEKAISRIEATPSMNIHLTNCHHRDVDRFLKALSGSNPGAVIVIRSPMATAKFTTEQLAEKGIVGLFEKREAE